MYPLSQFPLTGQETRVRYHEENINIDAVHSSDSDLTGLHVCVRVPMCVLLSWKFYVSTTRVKIQNSSSTIKIPLPGLL